jgi:hypothetical protein
MEPQDQLEGETAEDFAERVQGMIFNTGVQIPCTPSLPNPNPLCVVPRAHEHHEDAQATDCNINSLFGPCVQSGGPSSSSSFAGHSPATPERPATLAATQQQRATLLTYSPPSASTPLQAELHQLRLQLAHGKQCYTQAAAMLEAVEVSATLQCPSPYFHPPLWYSDEKVANRDTKVWHGAT